jgi:3-hydroxyisobutyrate dehydrogenase-like beta-hydroxyacid dehydrogenase
MDRTVTLIGFGEAGKAFANGKGCRAFDIKTDGPARDAKLAAYARAGVTGCENSREALDGATAVLCVVTADQALLAAQESARSIAPGTLFFDMNSVAPETKMAAATFIDSAGGCYVDVAVMSPVEPACLAVPLLISGPHAERGSAKLAALGFSNVRIIPGDVGRASSIKMIRSVMVKGMEALTAECLIAAERAGVTDEVVSSLGEGWHEKANYNLDRMMVHGVRRAAEMTEVVKTLESLGIDAMMTRETVKRQRKIGELGIALVPDSLEGKLERLK